jgi:hypothetical protein
MRNSPAGKLTISSVTPLNRFSVNGVIFVSLTDGELEGRGEGGVGVGF